MAKIAIFAFLLAFIKSATLLSTECSNDLFEIKNAIKTAQTLASCIVSDILSGGQHDMFHVNDSLVFGDLGQKCSCEIFNKTQKEVPQKLAKAISSCLLMEVGVLDDDDTVRQNMLSAGENMYESCPNSEPEFAHQELEKITLKEAFYSPEYRQVVYKIVLKSISALCKKSGDSPNKAIVNGSQYIFVSFQFIQMYLLTKLLT